MKYVVNMACGLANRMFQYAYYRFLEKMSYDVAVDYYTSYKLKHEKVGWLDIFPNAHFKQASRPLILKLGGGDSIFSKIRRRYLPKTTSIDYLESAFAARKPISDGKDKYLIGVFQNASVVMGVEKEIRAAFQFRTFEDEVNKQFLDRISQDNAVAIHVRKGEDYMSRCWYQNTCPVDYYRNAVDYMKKNVDSPKFFVFADNPQWVKENFSWLDYTLVDWNPSAGPGSHLDMQLMSLCHHNIISNSTYSWWSAFLNENPDKVVVLPRQWFNPSSCEQSTSEPVQCPGWIAL